MSLQVSLWHLFVLLTLPFIYAPPKSVLRWYYMALMQDEGGIHWPFMLVDLINLRLSLSFNSFPPLVTLFLEFLCCFSCLPPPCCLIGGRLCVRQYLHWNILTAPSDLADVLAQELMWLHTIYQLTQIHARQETKRHCQQNPQVTKPGNQARD